MGGGVFKIPGAVCTLHAHSWNNVSGQIARSENFFNDSDDHLALVGRSRAHAQMLGRR